MSKPQFIDLYMKEISKTHDMTKVFRVKRAGVDLNDIFYSIGKIHGLENIAFCDEDAIAACNGNPCALQKLVNDVEGPNKFYGSFEELLA